MMNITYHINVPVTVEQFIGLLRESTLGERRPIEDRACMQGMVEHSNLLVSAWDGAKLVGIARAMTDFHYACYVSDLAVAGSHQGNGIGRKLLSVTQEQLGPRCKLILVAAPAAHSYYKQLGFDHNPRCWVLERERIIGG